MKIERFKSEINDLADKTPRPVLILLYIFYVMIVVIGGGYAGDFWDKLKKKKTNKE